MYNHKSKAGKRSSATAPSDFTEFPSAYPLYPVRERRKNAKCHQPLILGFTAFKAVLESTTSSWNQIYKNVKINETNDLFPFPCCLKINKHPPPPPPACFLFLPYPHPPLTICTSIVRRRRRRRRRRGKGGREKIIRKKIEKKNRKTHTFSGENFVIVTTFISIWFING